MNYIALTINEKHRIFNYDINLVFNELKKYSDTYIDLVKHKKDGSNNEHYHALIVSKYNDEYFKAIKLSHVEKVRNVQAYTKYMHNHDVVDNKTSGELPFRDKYQERYEMIEYLIQHGTVETVVKYGWEALTKYHVLKMFYEDAVHYVSQYGKDFYKDIK